MRVQTPSPFPLLQFFGLLQGRQGGGRKGLEFYFILGLHEYNKLRMTKLKAENGTGILGRTEFCW